MGRQTRKPSVLYCLNNRRRNLPMNTLPGLAKEFKPGYVYVLRLANNKWYVGFTSRPHARMRQHFSGQGAKWTKTHKPIDVCRFYVGTQYLEFKITRDLIRLYGVENVRGAGYTYVLTEKAAKALLYIKPFLISDWFTSRDRLPPPVLKKRKRKPKTKVKT